MTVSSPCKWRLTRLTSINEEELCQSKGQLGPANYLTPTDKEISDAIMWTFGNNSHSYGSPNKGVDVQNVPHDLVRDIANLAAGGSIVEPSTLIENVYEDVKKRKSAAQQTQWNTPMGSVSYAYINKKGESTQRTTDNLSLAIKREFNRQVSVSPERCQVS